MSRLPPKLRRYVFQRAGFECEYCRGPQELQSADLEVDHIWPKGKGGKATADNLCAACRKCNEYKHLQTEATDSKTGKRLPLYNPRNQRWNEHFKFSRDYTIILGKTAVGRATVQALNLNRYRAVLLRQLWRKAGWHPPTN